MELAADEPGMVGYLDHLDERGVRLESGEPHATRLDRLAVRVVELVAMAVAFGDLLLAVDLCGDRAVGELARVGSEPHRPALLRQALLHGHEIDDRMRRIGVDLAR